MGREREVFCQERASGSYRASAYFVVKVLFDAIPLRAIPTMITGVLVYFLTGMQPDPALFGYFILITVMFSIITALICIAIAAIVANQALANLVAIVTLLFMMLFQGAMINLGARSPIM